MRQITKSFVDAARVAVPAALKAWADQQGVAVSIVGTAAWTSKYAKMTLQLAAIDNDTGVAQSEEVLLYEVNCNAWGLPSGACGKEFVLNGERYVLLGWRKGARTKALMARSKRNGKTYVFRHSPMSNVLRMALHAAIGGAPPDVKPETLQSETSAEDKWSA